MKVYNREIKKGGMFMNGNDPKGRAKKAGLAVAVPKEAVILYASNVHIHVSKFGVVLDVSQQVGSTKRHVVVSRVGMSREHAKALCEQLLRLLQGKPKKPQEMVIH